MKDVQNREDKRQVPINKVGIRIPQYRLVILDKKNKLQHIVASINMYVSLPHDQKGTHMSRFVEILNKYHSKPLSSSNVFEILKEMKFGLEAENAYIEMNFPYFIEKISPKSRKVSDMDYNCSFIGTLNCDHFTFRMKIEVPISSVCPCSMEISEVGAHNQRGKVTVTVDCDKFIWIEDIIKEVEKCGSCDVFSILKRPDEKFVTEKMFANPKFVEDIARDTYLAIKKFPVSYFSVEVENMESIHNHNAYAFIDYKKPSRKPFLGAGPFFHNYRKSKKS